MTRTILRRTGWTVLIALLALFVALASWEPFFAQQPGPPPPQRAYSAEVIRDEWGVPHIHGHTDADVAFGIAWAHAEDDFSTLQDVVAMTRGRYGAIAGKDGAGVDYAAHWLDARGTARRHMGELSPAVRAVLDGYASGLNRYAAKHPAELKLARLFPVNAEDIATGFVLRLPFFFGMDRVLGPLAEGKPPLPEHGPSLTGAAQREFGLGATTQYQPSPPMPLPMGETADSSGSNAFAVAPARSGDGTTRLISNSHQPYRGGVAWYEMELNSDEGWHFAGATFPGSPYPFVGHNETLGWTNTVNRPDLIDVWQLQLEADGQHYRYVDAPGAAAKREVLEQRRVWLPVRLGPLVLPVPRMVWRSKYGPAIVNAQGAFAVRYGGMDQLGAVEQYYRVTRAKTFDQWRQAMAIAGVPATNFIYADAAGNIAYWYNAAIPVRAPGPDWRNVVKDAPAWHSYVPWEQLPHQINPASGTLFNSNNTPLLAAGPGSELDPAKIPALWGVETDLTNRARRASKLLAEPGPITRERLLQIKFDTGYDRSGYVAWTLDAIAKLDLRGEPELQKAQQLLGSWDLTADGKGGADALAVMVLEPGMKASYGLKTAPDMHQVLADSVAHLQRHFGRIDPPLGEVLRIRRGTVDLPGDGGGDTLRAATDWDADPDGRLSVKHGDSFVMLVEWGKDGRVHSESIQPYGAATTRPDSPHYADQATLFAAHRFKPVHFERADVLKHAVRRIVVSND